MNEKWKPEKILGNWWIVRLAGTDEYGVEIYDVAHDVLGKRLAYGEWADAQAKADELNAEETL